MSGGTESSDGLSTTCHTRADTTNSLLEVSLQLELTIRSALSPRIPWSKWDAPPPELQVLFHTFGVIDSSTSQTRDQSTQGTQKADTAEETTPTTEGPREEETTTIENHASP